MHVVSTLYQIKHVTDEKYAFFAIYPVPNNVDEKKILQPSYIYNWQKLMLFTESWIIYLENECPLLFSTLEISCKCVIT